MSLTKKGII